MAGPGKPGRKPGGPRFGGRKKGTPNKATADAREAIGMFVEGNVHRLQAWLDEVANGKRDENGKLVVDPDPQKAFELFQSVIEYHVPKLARTEVYGQLTVNHEDRSVQATDRWLGEVVATPAVGAPAEPVTH